MIRKTFNDKGDATAYNNKMQEDSHTAVLMRLGGKFRVYTETIEQTEKMKPWRRDNWAKRDTEGYLRRIANRESEQVDNALTIMNALVSGDVYDDLDTTLDIARIMAEVFNELRTASDVFHFIDDTEHYTAKMEQAVGETLADCDYEGIHEVAEA